MLRERLIPDIWCCDSPRHISYLILTFIHLILAMLYLTLDIWHRYLPCYIWHMISDAGTCHAIFDTWYLTPILTMLYLTLDIWHRYLPCYIWHMISDTGTCHAILDTWYMILVLAMLYLTHDIWHRYLPCYIWHMISNTGTWHVITWPDIVTPDWILLHLTPVLHGIFMIITFTGTWHDYYIITRHLVLLNSCTPELLYPLYSCPPAPLLLLIAQSYRCPAEHAWCRDDEGVSHDRASVRRILNGTKCHTE